MEEVYDFRDSGDTSEQKYLAIWFAYDTSCLVGGVEVIAKYISLGVKSW